jgi:outer membrane protein assembly factor BamE (lipoprotein component of BamABCDE complex)
MKKTITTNTMKALLALSFVCSAGAAASEEDPSLEYSDVVMERPDFNEPFQRNGRTISPANVMRVVAGVTGRQVRALIGEPMQTGQGMHGPEWDYNLKLNLADEDFIVCQYKVVFDASYETVVKTAWRRYQCRDAMAAYLNGGS